jgi:hypothetical protein
MPLSVSGAILLFSAASSRPLFIPSILIHRCLLILSPTTHDCLGPV